MMRDYLRYASWYLTHPERAWVRLCVARRKGEVLRARLSHLPPAPAGRLPVCVSLTSYGDRIATVHLAIRSIMDQTIPPNRVVLWLSEESDGIPLTRELQELEALGLVVRRGVANLLSHKKYYFAMQEFGDCLLVTVDDDLLFARDVIETLLEAHDVWPHHVVARRTHRVTIHNDRIDPYVDWDAEFTERRPVPRRSLVATTGAGVLYPPELFSRLVCKNREFERIAPTSDDIWLKGVELKEGIDVAYAPNRQASLWSIIGTQGSQMLANQNVAGGANDVALERVMEHFSLSVQDFRDAGATGDVDARHPVAKYQAKTR